MVLLLAWAMRTERPDRGRLWGVLASVTGIVVIGFGNLWGGGSLSSSEIRNIVMADLLLVGAVVSWGGYIAVSKPLVERHGAMPAVAATVLVGCLLSLPVAVWTWPGLASFAQVSRSAWVALALWACSSRHWDGPFRTCPYVALTRARSPHSAMALPC